MKFKQHIEIGKRLYTKISDLDINKTAYIIGNVLPDLNCIYPAHRLVTTEQRFYKKLNYMNNKHCKILKSIQLGMITHYICDYFCYAHTIESIGLTHRKYEKNLYDFYKLHVKELETNNEKIKEQWLKSVNTASINSEYIMNRLKYMYNQYKLELRHCSNNVWANDISQIQSDLQYAMFMIDNIIDIILRPYKYNMSYI